MVFIQPGALQGEDGVAQRPGVLSKVARNWSVRIGAAVLAVLVLVAIAAPWMLAKAAFLLRHTHLEERRIWTAPIGQLLCYATAIEEQVTDAQVVTPEEHRAMAEQRELDRRLAAELVGTSAAAPKS